MILYFSATGSCKYVAQRLAAFGGTLSVSSPAGGPTTVAARIPLLLQEGEQGVPAPAPLSPTPRPSAVPPH